jgi:hypothetical protein
MNYDIEFYILHFIYVFLMFSEICGPKEDNNEAGS